MWKFLPAAAAAATGIQVGAAIVATRFVIGETAPASLALLRYAIGFLCLVPPLALAGRTRIARRDLLPIGLLGIVQFGVLIAALNYGLSLVPSARAALLFATFPLMAIVVGMAFGEERPTTAKTAGVLLTIVGVGLAIGESGLGSGSAPDDWRGDAAVLSSALAGAICSVLYRPYLRKYPTLPVSAFAMLASVGFLALLAAGEGFFNAFPHFTSKGWFAVLFIGVSSGVGYYLWLWALGRTTPTRVTVFLGLSPITATALGALLLGEPVSLTLAAGLGCVVLGLWIAHREPAARLG
ncbi:MAG TPA: DMT family transporter [Burkholderiales bacterium]|nr:DMT family transporter [Burkholderiales bacterium]